MSHVENRNPTRFSQGSVGKEPRDESCGSKPRSTALRAHVGRRTMSSREREGGWEGQEGVCFLVVAATRTIVRVRVRVITYQIPVHVRI